MKHYKVYQYRFPDGMLYIGMTKNSIEVRRDQGYQHNLRLKQALRNAGWKNVLVIILADNLSFDEACEKEKYFIEKYHTTDESVGYNLSGGGKSTYAGLRYTDEYKQHMSDLYNGRKFSKETLERMKESHKKERKPVACFTIDGEQIGCYESLHAAAKAFGCHPSNISRACKKEAKTCKGYIWYFV